MRRACILLAVGVLLGAGPVWAGERGCGCCAPAKADCKDGKIKHCCKRLAGWICYVPATRTGLDCIGRVPPAAYPPLYTFFPCTACNALPPAVVAQPGCTTCAHKHKTCCTFPRKKSCASFSPCTGCSPCAAGDQHAGDKCPARPGAHTNAMMPMPMDDPVQPAVLGQPQMLPAEGSGSR